MVRIAKVTVRGRDTTKTVAAYLPQNYRILGNDGPNIIIGGVDNRGWTLDDYIIPRLASGMMICKEIDLTLEAILEYDPLDILGD